jgi:hypothetical protein
MNNLREVVFKNTDFPVLSNNITVGQGSHSLRKFASTWYHQNGATHQDGKRPVTKLWPDVISTHVDGKVESLLCVGGPIAYRLIVERGATMERLYASVIPGIVAHFGANHKKWLMASSLKQQMALYVSFLMEARV